MNADKGMTLKQWSRRYGKYAVRDLALMTGVHRTTIQNVIDGKTTATPRVACLIEVCTDGEVRADRLLELDVHFRQARKDRRHLTAYDFKRMRS